MWMLTITMLFFPPPLTMQEDQLGYPNQMRPNGANFGIGGSKKRFQPHGGAFGNLSIIPYNTSLHLRKYLMSLNNTITELHTSHKRLHQRWEATKTVWNDPVQQNFEKQHWTPLDKQTQPTLKEMERLAQAKAM